MKTFKIRIITEFKTKTEWFIPGEVHEARRLSYNFVDFKTPFQIVSGERSGAEVPFKYAVVIPEEPQPTQQQFNRLVEQNRELLDKLERQTVEQLNAEKLLQRIKELETIAQGRDEMINSLQAELEDVRSTQQPVELPQNVASALDWLKFSRYNAAQIIRLSLDGNNGPSGSQVLYQFVSTRTGLNELIYALVYGYTAAPEQDEAAAMLGNVTALVEEWYHSPATDNDTEVLAEQSALLSGNGR